MLSHIIMWLTKRVRQQFCWHVYKLVSIPPDDGRCYYYKCVKCDRISKEGLK